MHFLADFNVYVVLQVVLFPITVGLVLNTYAKGVVNAIQPIMPFVAMICTSLCIGSPLAINRRQILSSDGLCLLLPIMTFHLLAFTIGYWLSKLPSLRYILFFLLNFLLFSVPLNQNVWFVPCFLFFFFFFLEIVSPPISLFFWLR